MTDRGWPYDADPQWAYAALLVMTAVLGFLGGFVVGWAFA